MSQNPYGAPQPLLVSVRPPTSGMAVAALVLGIVGVLGGWCTFAVPCVLAIIFGCVGLSQTRDGTRSGRGMAIAGLVLGLVPAVIIAVIMIVGGIGALMTPVSSLSSRTSEQVEDPAARGPVVPLENTLTVNLADDHYLKLGLALQLAPGQPAQLDTSTATNLAVENYTGRSIAELSTEQGRISAKEKLREDIVQAYQDAVVDVYFTAFVTQ
ncbi:flagellar basal body-associated FliL family protein [Actinoplanes sp. NPDC051861]|uniref:flagellar basal body-associated FliL family protein n=1 Tax=Actinoplanes sp. NPDC051861 TaxID=3155170 RepID=UPI00341AF5F0